MKNFIKACKIFAGLFVLLSLSCQSAPPYEKKFYDDVQQKYGVDLLAIEQARVLPRAEQYLLEAPVPMTPTYCERSAGGRQDFYSEGDYWWPNPEDPDGAYIRRDGESNPDNFSDHRHAMVRLSIQVASLAAAWKLTGETRFAEHAMRHLRTWFIDDSTRMNPHLLYAQAIKGRVTGRGVGIIDTIHLVEVARAVSVLEDADGVSSSDIGEVKRWFADYLEWMTTHEYGIDERERKNNHGTCWVMQVAEFARLTGNDTLLQMSRNRFREVLLVNQLASDGSYPLELKRTKPYGYCLFNLDAMATVCHILADGDNDIWRFALPEGQSFATAMAYMHPFIANKSAWPLPPDVMYDEEWPVRHPALLFAGLALEKEQYIETWSALDGDPEVAEVIRNFPIRQPILWLP